MLEGIRVLDVTRFVAGPISTALLADLGADVIHIEPPGGGEDREILPIKEGFHSGVGFTQCNRNKRGLALDLASDRGKQLFGKLLATADIVVANMPHSSIASLGLDYETLCTTKPDIIFVHLTTFGREGPYADNLGFDAIAQVMSGLTYLSGDAGKPMKSAAAWVDMATGFVAAFGAMAALRHRDRTGEGQLVEANLLQTALLAGNYFLIEEYFNEYGRGGTGNRAQSGGPADLVPTSDGWVYAVALGDRMFKRFMTMIGRPELVEDARFRSDELRSENGELLSEIVAQWSSRLTTEEALWKLAEYKIPAGPLLSPREALADPHISRYLMQAVPVPGLSKPVPYARPPVSFGKMPAAIQGGPPAPGADTDAILRDIGLAPDDIAELRRDSII